MERKFLEDLGFTKEQIDQVMAEHGKTVQDTKVKLEQVEKNAKSLQESLDTRDKDIEELKKTSGLSDDLKTQLADLQGKYDTDKADYEAELIQTKKDSAIDLALVNAKARNPKAVKALLDTEKLGVEADVLKLGLETQLKALQESDAYLFGEEQAQQTQQEQTPPPAIVPPGNPTPPNHQPTDPFAAKLAKYQ